MEVHREDCWVLLGSTRLPHLRSFLRARPDFDPSLERNRQESLGHIWAKEFWDREHEKGTPPPEWFQSWTTIKNKSGSSSRDCQDTGDDSWCKMTNRHEAAAEFPSLDENSFEEEDETGSAEGEAATAIKFVASGSALEGDEDWQGRLSHKDLKLFEKKLEEAILRDERCFAFIRKYVTKALTPDERPRGVIRSGNPTGDQLRRILDSINKLFDCLRAKMTLPSNSASASVTILRPLDRYLEHEVGQAHNRSGKHIGLSELLDQLDVLLGVLGVPAPRGETVISDRLVHQYLYRLSDCRERLMAHRQRADATRQAQTQTQTQTQAQAQAQAQAQGQGKMARHPGPSMPLPSELGQRRGSRYVSRPLECRGGSPILPPGRRNGYGYGDGYGYGGGRGDGDGEGANSRASSASVGSFVAEASASTQQCLGESESEAEAEAGAEAEGGAEGEAGEKRKGAGAGAGAADQTIIEYSTRLSNAVRP